MKQYYGWIGGLLGVALLACIAQAGWARAAAQRVVEPMWDQWDSPAQVAVTDDPAHQDDETPAAEAGAQPPPPPEGDKPHGRRPGAHHGRRPPGPDRPGPAMRGQHPPMREKAGGPDGRPAMRGKHPRMGKKAGGPPEAMLLDRLMPLIAEQHPDLAKRLRDLRRQSPEEYRRVVAEALAVRLEEAMRHRGQPGMPFGPHPMPEGGPGHLPPGGGPRPPMFGGPPDHPPMPPDRPDWDEPGGEPSPEMREFEMHMRELDRHNEELERKSMELAHKLAELREREEPKLDELRERLRRELAECVEEHFNVRTEFRKAELHRLETELGHLKRALDELRENLERRERARGAIIERRIKQLLGEDGDAW